MIRNPIGTRENIRILDTSTNAGLKVEVLEYQKLMGLSSAALAPTIYFMEKQNIRVRQIALSITNDSVKVEPGAMSYFQGNIEMVSGVTAGNIVGRVFSSMTTGEAIAQPEYKGTGLLVLEPSFKHFIVLELEKGEQIIVDKGMFYCAQGSVEVKPVMQKKISAALMGGEGIFQLSMTGPGLVVMECGAPMTEIDIIEINNDVLKVDGNFAILRSGNIEFTVERSAKTLIGSAVSGEGLVNVYRGTGQIWLAPTLKVYKSIEQSVFFGSDIARTNMNTSKS